jgi:hypothetical protein
MSSPPETDTEYSRATGASGHLAERRERRFSGLPSGIRSGAGADEDASPRVAGVVLGALLGALLVIVSQFTVLYHLRSATSSAVIKTVGTGANHAYAPIPLALLAIVLAVAIYRHPGRPAVAGMAGLVVVGLATLGIALLGDLPDAHTSGLIGSTASQFVEASASPDAGLYMETLGGVVLLASGGLGLIILAGRPRGSS